VDAILLFASFVGVVPISASSVNALPFCASVYLWRSFSSGGSIISISVTFGIPGAARPTVGRVQPTKRLAASDVSSRGIDEC
jgi:hypothetical protein